MKRKPKLIISAFLFLFSNCDKDTSNATLGAPSPILDEYGHEPVYDNDGHQFLWVEIGQQGWMEPNLNSTKYRNGDPISTDPVNTWYNLTTGAYCNYNDSSGYSAIYGHLYNWYAVNDTRNICPVGFHIPTMSEWTTLVNYLGGPSLAGGRMKEYGFSYWASPNTGATYGTRFKGRPGGYFALAYADVGYGGYWWSANDLDSTQAYCWTLEHASTMASWYSFYKSCGFSVRCIKD